MMPISLKAFFCAVLISIFIDESSAFDTQFLGTSLTDEEYSRREFCSTKYCILDNDRLIYSASQNSTLVNPCEDFKTFALGEFFKHRVLNDRYAYIGFNAEVQSRLLERQRIVLKKPVTETDPIIFKLVKSYFQNCTNSG